MLTTSAEADLARQLRDLRRRVQGLEGTVAELRRKVLGLMCQPPAVAERLPSARVPAWASPAERERIAMGEQPRW